MELKGKIIAVLPMKSGTSAKGDWKSQQYVLETDDKYPKRLLFDVLGEDKINEFGISMGDVLTVSFVHGVCPGSNLVGRRSSWLPALINTTGSHENR